MIKVLSENLLLKVIAVIASVTIWLYVSAERTPIVTRQVNAEVITTGTPPPDLIVRIKPVPVPVEVSGPSAEVESIGEGDVKAMVNVHSARTTLQLLPI